MYIATLLFAISVSIDALGVGTTYGLKKIKIAFLPKFLMSALSFLYSGAAVWLGGCLSQYLPQKIGSLTSGIMLGGIGLYSLFDAIRSSRRDISEETLALPQPQTQTQKNRRILHRFIKPLGISITIVKHPTAADFDHSRSIDWKESLYIGLALSFDAIGAGIGYSLGGKSGYLLPVLIGGFQFLFLSLGCFLGRKVHQLPYLNSKTLSFLPGLIILGLAITRFL